LGKALPWFVSAASSGLNSNSHPTGKNFALWKGEGLSKTIPGFRPAGALRATKFTLVVLATKGKGHVSTAGSIQPTYKFSPIHDHGEIFVRLGHEVDVFYWISFNSN